MANSRKSDIMSSRRTTMGRQKIRQLTLSGWSVAITAILLIVFFLAWMSYRFLEPFSSQNHDSGDRHRRRFICCLWELYKQALARDGIRVNLKPTSGAVDNLKLPARQISNGRRRICSGHDRVGLRNHQILSRSEGWHIRRYGFSTGS